MQGKARKNINKNTDKLQRLVLVTHSAGETAAAGKKLAATLRPGDVVLLNGELGAGKTHFTQGICEGLGIDAYAVSPTFTIVNEYRSGRSVLNHMDVYRLSDFDELIDIGFDDYLSGGGITVIEWADKFEELSQLPERTFKVSIERVDGPEQDKRRITIMCPCDPGCSGADGNKTERE
ncbi:MAG: tRNA (adenosine(37)-N6)-threonylcarbamoyltransferase complex ATPase subunit type 1 TsaE [Clostridia bacterium]|nr:tRNA (adenosine(37)-N6)-threonylcarbamoyltransferase complex ATPase subunit type 1 TsaE [Clostridia bacterium]